LDAIEKTCNTKSHYWVETYFTKEGIKNGKGFATFVMRKRPHLGMVTMKITPSLVSKFDRWMMKLFHTE
jgi:hypothetical protein